MNLSHESQITLVELPPTLYGTLNGDPGYDIYNMFMLPPRALPTLAAVMMAKGWKNVDMLNPLFHGKNGKFTNENWKRIFGSNILMISSITRTSKQSMALADKYKKYNPLGIIIVGGMDPSYRIKEWLNHADIVVIGEAEKTLPELLDKLQNNHSLKNIKGIAYKVGNKIKINPKRELMTLEELNQLPSPYYDNKIIEKSTIGVIEQERGCPFDCNFCLVTETYGSKIRYFPFNKILREIKQMQGYGLDPFFFSGDNFAGNPEYAIKMLKAIKKAGLSRYGRTAQVSVSAAYNPELLRLMRDIGIKHLCIGFEAVTDSALKSINKPFNSKQNTEAAQIFHKYGFWIHAMMMFGTDSDNYETARQTVEWAKKHADSIQLFIPTPFPGTPFFSQMEKEERILTKDWSLYDAQHCVIKPKNFSAYKLQKLVFDMYKEFYSFKMGLKRIFSSPRRKIAIVFALYVLFGGLRKITSNPQTKQYLKFLKSIS